MTNELKLFTDAFFEALYFTETDGLDRPDGDTPLEPETKANLEADCRSFWWRNACWIKAEKRTDETKAIKQAGHDFWFTRNGHGSGFWDGGWSIYGDKLTSASEAFGVVDVFEYSGGLAA